MVVACCREKSAAVNVFGRPAATTAAVPPLTRTLTLTRVVFVCWLQYIVDLAVPEAQWIKPEIANGEHVDWLRICGWMTTRHALHRSPPPPSTPIHAYSERAANDRASAPVLILFLVSITLTLALALALNPNPNPNPNAALCSFSSSSR